MACSVAHRQVHCGTLQIINLNQIQKKDFQSISIHWNLWCKKSDLLNKGHAEIWLDGFAWDAHILTLLKVTHIQHVFQIIIKSADSSPAVNKFVFLLLCYGPITENWTLKTDSEGVAHFSLDTSAVDTKYFQLKVRSFSLSFFFSFPFFLLFDYHRWSSFPYTSQSWKQVACVDLQADKY